VIVGRPGSAATVVIGWLEATAVVV